MEQWRYSPDALQSRLLPRPYNGKKNSRLIRKYLVQQEEPSLFISSMKITLGSDKATPFVAAPLIYLAAANLTLQLPLPNLTKLLSYLLVP